MRTDGVQMAREAVTAIRDHVKRAYGGDYLPAAPREYQSKIKNAQEAHEAIRPTDVARTPGRGQPLPHPPTSAGCTSWCGSAPSPRRWPRRNSTRSASM